MKSDALGYLVIGSLAAILLGGCTEPPTTPEAQPNLVLIVIDALRAGDLSCYGAERATSPGIDALAASSTLFTHPLSVGGNTTTAMSAMMTGRLPGFDPSDVWVERTYFGMHRFYRNDEESGLPRSLSSLAELLGKSGYTTAGVITNPFLKKQYSFDQGFDHFTEIFHERGIPFGPADEVTAEALRLLGTPGSDQKPFFLYLHYMDVHSPYLPPPEFRVAVPYQRSSNTDQEAIERWEDLDIRGRQLSQDIEQLREHVKGLYDCSIRFTDHHIAELIEHLTDLGLMERTIVVITSDHGEEFLEHGGTTHKGTLYEELVRVPLIIYLPAQSPQTIDAVVRNFDLMPTLLDYAGADLQPLDAVSLRPLIEGEPMQDLSVYASFPHIRTLRDRQFKLVWDQYGRELYDLSLDPDEQVNIYQSTDQQLKDELESRLNAQYQALLSANTSAADISVPQGNRTDHVLISKEAAESLDPETREQLRKLGYLEVQ